MHVMCKIFINLVKKLFLKKNIFTNNSNGNIDKNSSIVWPYIVYWYLCQLLWTATWYIFCISLFLILYIFFCVRTEKVLHCEQILFMSFVYIYIYKVFIKKNPHLKQGNQCIMFNFICLPGIMSCESEGLLHAWCIF